MINCKPGSSAINNLSEMKTLAEISLDHYRGGLIVCEIYTLQIFYFSFASSKFKFKLFSLPHQLAEVMGSCAQKFFSLRKVSAHEMPSMSAIRAVFEAVVDANLMRDQHDTAADRGLLIAKLK